MGEADMAENYTSLLLPPIFSHTWTLPTSLLVPLRLPDDSTAMLYK